MSTRGYQRPLQRLTQPLIRRADGLAPAQHLAEMVAKGWTTGREALFAWLTPAADGAARGVAGCPGVWGANVVANFTATDPSG